MGREAGEVGRPGGWPGPDFSSVLAVPSSFLCLRDLLERIRENFLKGLALPLVIAR